MDRNWQKWNYQLKIYSLNGLSKRSVHPRAVFLMDDDYFFWIWPTPSAENCTAIDRKTMKVKFVSIMVAD